MQTRRVLRSRRYPEREFHDARSVTPGLRAAERERVSIGEWVQAALLATNLVWTTLCLGGYRPETMLVTLALTGALVVVYFVTCAVGKRPLPPSDRAAWWTTPFLAYALFNVVFITPVPWLGWLDWLAWANMLAVFWVVRNGIRSARPRRVLFFTLVALGIVAVLLGSYQRFVQPGWLMLGRSQVEQFLNRASGPFGIPNSLAAFLILLLPAASALACRRHATPTERVWWGWVALVFGFGLLLTVSRGAWIALGLALVAWPLSVARWKWRRRALAAFVVLALVLSAGAVIYQSAPGVRERFDRLANESGELSRPILWRAAWEIFRTYPIAGGGAASYNVRFEQHRPAGFLDEPQWAHNEYLNTLSDYGAIGFVLFFGAGVAVIAGARRLNRASSPDSGDWLDCARTRQGMAFGVLAFALQMFLDFHLKIPALAMSFGVVSALSPGSPQRAGSFHTSAAPRFARAGWLLAAVAVMIALIPILRLYRAETLRTRAREAMDSYAANRPGSLPMLLNGAESDLRRANLLAPNHAGAWADLAHALELRALVDSTDLSRLSGPAVAAAKRATELSSSVPEFWIRLGVGLDMGARRLEAEKAFENALRLAPKSSHAWYYYAYHLSFDTERRDDALRAIAASLSLDPGNAAAEALQVKLNERPSGAPFNP
ncbi:MAG: O-antigen ligase family protein [Opitutaceae bacterium]